MKRKYLAIILAVHFLVTDTVWAAAPGTPVPSCQARKPDGTGFIDPRDFIGKVVYLDFWASWCGPCRQSLPFLDELQRRYKDRGFQVLGIGVDENPGEARKFLIGLGVGFPVGLDPDGDCPSQFQLLGMPAAYLIDRKGIIRYVHLGFRKEDRPQLQRWVEALLADE